MQFRAAGDHMICHMTCTCIYTELTTRLHHLIELGLNVQLWVFGLHTLQLDGHLDPCLDVGAWRRVEERGKEREGEGGREREREGEREREREGERGREREREGEGEREREREREGVL